MLTDPACLLMFQLLSKILDVIDDPDWTQSLGNAFASQYNLYVGDYKHSALLHRHGLYPHDSHDVMDVFISSLCFKETVYMPRGFLGSTTLSNTADIAKRH
jgi:hypothetical protein